MNNIAKSKNIPLALVNAGAAKQQCIDAVAAGEEPSYDKRIYADKDVKATLKADQHNKCAYCERYLNGDYGAVEHYRPKGGYTRGGGQPLVKPGYYWLAYDWDNLLYSCSECNTSFKRNLFPLLDENARKIESMDVSKEEPLLLNPAKDNVGAHIAFRRYMVVSKILDDGTKSKKGKTTIDILKLNDREDLKCSRKRVWERYEQMKVIRYMCEITKNFENIPLIDEAIKDLTGEDSEFTGMFKFQE